MFELHPHDRLLVIAPHPDDETLGVGGIIWQATQQHIPVHIVFLTNGDGNRVGVGQFHKQLFPNSTQYREYGTMRQDEALVAISHLGLSKSDTSFLGLPDQGLKRILEPQHASLPYRSALTGVDHTPYTHSYSQYLPYTQEAIQKALGHIIDINKPTHILLPLPEDTHNDHQAAASFILSVCHHHSPDIKLWAYPVHYRLFPKPRGLDTDLPLHPPKLHPRKDWHIIPLEPAARQAKHQAVEAYRSQLHIPLLGKLMFSLVRSNELLLPLN